MDSNGYLNLTSCINDRTLKKFKNFKNLYIKIRSSRPETLKNIQDISPDFLTIEIINDCKHALRNELGKLLPDRIIVTLSDSIDITLLKTFSSYNLSLDLYWSNPSTLKETLKYLIKHCPNINHFSIYPTKSPLCLEDVFLDFKRYHHNMWSRNPEKYYAYYDLKTIRDKKYSGLGRDSVSRDTYQFYKNNRKIELSREYVELQDHIDRFNYYIPLSKEEFSEYRKVSLSYEEYLKEIERTSVRETHQQIIYYLI